MAPYGSSHAAAPTERVEHRATERRRHVRLFRETSSVRDQPSFDDLTQRLPPVGECFAVLGTGEIGVTNGQAVEIPLGEGDEHILAGEGVQRIGWIIFLGFIHRQRGARAQRFRVPQDDIRDQFFTFLVVIAQRRQQAVQMLGER